MTEYDGISHFHKAGLRHLRDARELLETPTWQSNEQGAATRHLQGALYLAGYAVECAFKEYIISREPRASSLTMALQKRRERDETIPDIMGANGHNLALLLGLTDLEEALPYEAARKKDWGTCLRWKSVWRYAPAVTDADFARDFVASVGRIHAWIVWRV